MKKEDNIKEKFKQALISTARVISDEFLSKNDIALMRLSGFDLFFPSILSLGPWSGEILINGNPNVILIASYSYKVFKGPST